VVADIAESTTRYPMTGYITRFPMTAPLQTKQFANNECKRF